MENEGITFDPSLRASLPLATSFRVFGEETDLTRPLPRRPPRPFAVQTEETTIYTDGSCRENGATSTTAGSGLWYGRNDDRNAAARVPGREVSNQIAELYAVNLAVYRTPPFAPLNIVSDSRYVVDGLTTHLPKWEDRGWTGIQNRELIQEVVSRLRARSAPTTFKWVKGHSGVEGNEGADKLAEEGAALDEQLSLQLPMPAKGYVASGARLYTLTQKLAYRAIRERDDTPRRRAMVLTMERVLATLADWDVRVKESVIWGALRKTDMRRGMRDFWWKALHGALRVGKYWNNVPDCEVRASCQRCEVEENLEHILLECVCPGQARIWTLVRGLFDRRGITLPRITFGIVLAGPVLSLAKLRDKKDVALDRLLRIVVTESTHLIWRLRCERVIEPTFDPQVNHSQTEIDNRWLDALNRRLTMDQYLTAKKFGKKGVSKAVVLRTWREVLDRPDRLPEDWILQPGVLVGNPLRGSVAGVG